MMWSAIGLCFGILLGGFASYFVIKQYCDFKKAAESAYANEEDRISAMALSGGVNNCAIVLVIVLIVVINLVMLALTAAAIDAND
ncbi:MAG: hypothetical protein LBT81_05770 [Helicobacteraceae bacterium]|nr:hypothetical protein [Helicobacteraceae bacterium]